MAYPAPSDNTITPITAPEQPSLEPSLPLTEAAPKRTPTRGLYLGGRRLRARSPSIQDPESDSNIRRRTAVSEEKAGDSTTIELTDIDRPPNSNNNNNGSTHSSTDDEVRGHAEHHEAKTEEGESHIHNWTERLHGQRPDRHLFPYRSAKENMHAARTFLRRFFFLFLIVPAWVLPNVLTAKAAQDLELSHHSSVTGVGHGMNGTLGLLIPRAATAAPGGGHGPELSKGANVGIFILNMLVMMHLGKAAGAALEELVPRFGHRIISVFDAMTSSSVELAVAAFALNNGLIFVVQAAMLGAILNNLLLMMGIAIAVGGIANHQQVLKKETTQTSVNILMLTSLAYIVPVALDITLTSIRVSALSPTLSEPIRRLQLTEIDKLVDGQILTLSKIMSFILLLLYGACLRYQYSHSTFMITPEAKHEGPHTVDHRYTHFWFAGFAYTITMAAQIYSAYLLVHAVEGLGRQFHLNDGFVGFILLPIVLVADLQEEVIAIRESRSNRLDKAVALMVGSCMQIALLVTPVLVLLGWIMDKPMTLRFTVLEVAILVGSVLLVNCLISDHETNWLEGMMLIAVFIMCAIAFYYDVAHLVPSGAHSISGEGEGGGDVGAGH
ncbi:hypothetical protein BGZ72_006550 [Mortierella alpina]|nr:hypothetical protein BGZ72_006550 [Mortierella alpina]